MTHPKETSINLSPEQSLSESSKLLFQDLSFQELIKQAKGFVEKELWDEAITSYQKALAIQPVPQAWIYLALGPLLVRKGRIDEAIECYKRAIALNPEVDKTYTQMGIALEEKQLTSEAISSYHKAIKLNRDQPAWLYQRLANALHQRAVEDYNQSAINYMAAMSLQDRFSNFDKVSSLLQKTSSSLEEHTEQSIQTLWKTLDTKENTENSASYVFARHLTEFGFFDPNNSPVNPAGYYFINERLKTVYCSIPKNACTLFKAMLIDNSEFKDEFEASRKSVHEFINQKIEDTSATHLLECLESDEYFKFVVLRNPFSRIVSGYLDKFAKHRIPELFVQEIIQNVQVYLGKPVDIEKSITFTQFVDYLTRTPDYLLNDHWRPQHNFVARVKFDFIGQFEALGDVIDSLENKFDIKIRKEVSSHVTHYQQFDGPLSFHNIYPHSLRELGGMPKPSQLFTPELIIKSKIRYRQDVDLYKKRFKDLPNPISK